MGKELTPKQAMAIAKMNDAIAQLKKTGIMIFGMDDTLYYTTSKAIKECKKQNPNVGTYYCDGADTYHMLKNANGNDDRCGNFKTEGVYIDSGGW